MSNRAVTLLAATLLVAATALVGKLAFEVRALRATAVRERARGVLPRRGGFVPPARLALFGDGGAPRDTVTLGVGDSTARQVVLYFASSCALCRTESALWRSLAARAERMGIDPAQSFVAVSFEPSDSAARVYAAAQGWPFRAAHVGDRRTTWFFRGGASPVTLVVDGTGAILFARAGSIGRNAGIDSVLAALAPVTSMAQRRVADSEGR